jgi:SAM-dependent methyltransferase
VVGLDVNPEMLAAARVGSPPGALPNLAFLEGDILDGGWQEEFDLVTAARVLQWIPRAERTLPPMIAAARPGGLVMVLDYDHTRAHWAQPPAAWTRFYAAFLDWRAAGGLDNAIVERLPRAFEAAGLAEVRVIPHVTAVRAGEPDFFRVAGIWRLTADSRGRQMVAAGHLSERERAAAFADYTEWMQTPAAALRLHEACVLGRRTEPRRPR